MSIELTCVIPSGRTFHNAGPLTENDVPPSLVRHLGTTRRNLDEGLKSLEGL